MLDFCIWTYTASYFKGFLVWVQWHAPVIPALWDANARGPLEVRSSRLTVSYDHATVLQPG